MALTSSAHSWVLYTLYILYSYNVISSKKPSLTTPSEKGLSPTPTPPMHTHLFFLSLNSYSSPSEPLAWAWTCLSSDSLLTLPCVPLCVGCLLARLGQWQSREKTGRCHKDQSQVSPASISALGGISAAVAFPPWLQCPWERTPQSQLLSPGLQQCHLFPLILQLTVVAASYCVQPLGGSPPHCLCSQFSTTSVTSSLHEILFPVLTCFLFF